MLDRIELYDPDSSGTKERAATNFIDNLQETVKIFGLVHSKNYCIRIKLVHCTYRRWNAVDLNLTRIGKIILTWMFKKKRFLKVVVSTMTLKIQMLARYKTISTEGRIKFNFFTNFQVNPGAIKDILQDCSSALNPFGKEVGIIAIIMIIFMVNSWFYYPENIT